MDRQQIRLLNELDEILKFIIRFNFFETVTYYSITQSKEYEKMEINFERLNNILRQLIEDGYILEKETDILWPDGKKLENFIFCFIPTWKGEYFSSSSGYLKRVQMENQKYEYQLENRKWTILIATLATAGTVGLLFLELVKFCVAQEDHLICIVLWVGIAILYLLLRKAIVKIFH